MAILAEQCLKLIEQKMALLPYSYWEALPPEPTAYPFIVANFISHSLSFTFTTDMEKIKFQFSVFDNSPNKYRCIQILKELECLWDKRSYQFLDSDGGISLICIERADERWPYLGEDDFFQCSMDFIFFAQRLSGCNNAESTSSSSSDVILYSSSSTSSSSYIDLWSSSSFSSSSSSSSEGESLTSTSSRTSSSTSSES